MIYAHQDYRTFLRDLLAERQGRNKSYSLRAMARDLGLQPSHLSDLLKGVKGLSLSSTVRLARCLGLNAGEAEYFHILVQLGDPALDPDSRDVLLQKARTLSSQKATITDLSVDLFKAISDWYHLAILELTSVRDFNPAPKAIAVRLGITALEAQTALERLLRLEIIEADGKGGYRRTKDNILFATAAPNDALRRYHRQMLTKASESLETQKQGERYIGSNTFSLDEDQLPKAFALVAEFREKLVALANERPTGTRVYHMGVQMFALTRKKK